MTFTKDSDWRALGDITKDQMKTSMQSRSSPMLAELDPIVAATAGRRALYSAHAFHESEWATTGEGAKLSDHNAVGNTVPGSDHVYMQFGSWADGATWWWNHVTDPNGPYAKTKTIAEYVHVYAPASDGNDEQEYIDVILQFANMNGSQPVSTTTTTTDPTQDISKLNMTRGLIPMPPFIDDIIDVSKRNASIDCRGYDYLGQRVDPPEFLVLHRSQDPPGTSNSGYFHQACCPALTDFEVIASTGQARRFVDISKSNVAGWANGVVSSPYGDALKYLDFTGWDLNRVNKNGEAVEITGYFAQPGSSITADSPVSEAAWAWLAQWIASRAHDYGIPWFQFPIIVKENNRSYLTWHQEWTIGTGKVCPGKVVMDYTTTLIQRAAAIMKAAQTGTVAPQPPATKPPATGVAPHPLPKAAKPLIINGNVYWPFPQVVTLTAVRDSVCHEYADPNSATTTSGIVKKGEKANFWGSCAGDDGDLYLIGTGGSRLKARDFIGG